MKQNLQTVITGCLIALALWRTGEWAWNRYGWQSLWLWFVVWLLLNAAYMIRKWFRGRKGLNQWPNPYGRYYDEWMKLPEGVGDYYDWLARKMGNREPWATWAQWDKKT